MMGVYFTYHLIPSLDQLLSALQQFGKDARLFKVDISCAFQNVPVDPGDAIHLGIKPLFHKRVMRYTACGMRLFKVLEA